MEFFLFINVKMPTIIGINCWHFNIYGQENSILGLSEPENAEFLDIFYTCEHLKIILVKYFRNWPNPDPKPISNIKKKKKKKKKKT